MWRTMTGTLRRLPELTPDPDVRHRVDEIAESLEAAPKNWRFRARAKVGERVPWYVLPDEVG